MPEPFPRLSAILLLWAACVGAKPDPSTECPGGCTTDSAATSTTDSTADSTPTTPTETGDPTESVPPVDADGDGYSVEAGDCDDADATRNPGAAEVSDGVDQDCDGEPDDGLRPVATYRRWEVVVADGAYVSGRTYTEFQNELGDVICTFAAPWGEGTPPATLCPDCTWAFGFEGGTWTSSGPKCEWIQTSWYDLDYLNYRTKTGSYDRTYGYSPTAWNEDHESTAYQQIWRYDVTRTVWTQTGTYNGGGGADNVYEYGSGTYVFGGRWYNYYY